MEQYRRLHLGMSEDEFRSIVTTPCSIEIEGNSPGYSGKQLKCQGEYEFSAIIVGIGNGKVTFLTQIGLDGGFG